MKIDISDLKHEQGSSAPFVGEEGLKSLSFMGEEICFKQPLQVEGTVTNTDVGFLVSGTVTAHMQRQCGRCTELFPEVVEARFDMVYRQAESTRHQQETHVDEGEADEEDDVVYFKGNVIHIQDVILESLIMAIPMKAVCSDECKGLCITCGQNLNDAECTCAEERVDDRLSALKELLNKD